MRTPDPNLAPAPVEANENPAIRGKKLIGLISLLTASFMLAVDFSILSVALPSIGVEFDISPGNLQWIITAFALASTGFTLFFARVADIWGRRKLFLFGIGLLGLASFAGGIAPDFTSLIAARSLQGLATAAAVPTALALITTSFPEGPARARALSLNAALMAAGFTTGAILSGVITDAVGWRWTFFVNVPIAAVVLLLVPLSIAESRGTRNQRLDFWGAVTITLSLTALVYGTANSVNQGWGTLTSGAMVACGVAGFIAFFFIERRSASPLLPSRLMSKRATAIPNLAGILAFLTETSLVFLLTIQLQDVLNLSPLQTGFCFGFLGLGTVIGGTFGGRIVGRIGAGRAITFGFTLQGLCVLLLIFTTASITLLGLTLALLVVQGAASLIATVGFVVAATSEIEEELQGAATGLVTVSQQVGIAIGTPVLATIFAFAADGGSTTHAIAGAFITSIIANAVFCFVGAILGLTISKIRPVRSVPLE